MARQGRSYGATLVGARQALGVGSPPTDLVIQDATHAHAADNVALVVDLAIQDATHAHSADNLVLTQVHNLTVQDATHGHSADNVALVVDLAIQDATHGHTADNVALTQAHNLAVQDASHTHTADNLALTQVHNLVIADALHGHSADNLDLTQVHVLAVADALHAHAADNVVLSTETATDLVIQDATHGHTTDGFVFTQVHILAIQDATHAHRTDAWDAATFYEADGFVTYNADGTITISDNNSGDFWNTADNGTLISRGFTAPAFFEADVDFAVNGQHLRMLGVRSGTNANAAMFVLLWDNDNTHIGYVYRDTDGAVAGYSGINTTVAIDKTKQLRLKIAYVDGVARGWASEDGGAWQFVGERAIAGLDTFFMAAGGSTNHADPPPVYTNEIQLSQVNVLAIGDATHGHTADHIHDIGGDFDSGDDNQPIIRMRRHRTKMGSG